MLFTCCSYFVAFASSNMQLWRFETGVKRVSANHHFTKRVPYLWFIMLEESLKGCIDMLLDMYINV